MSCWPGDGGLTASQFLNGKTELDVEEGKGATNRMTNIFQLLLQCFLDLDIRDTTMSVCQYYDMIKVNTMNLGH